MKEPLRKILGKVLLSYQELVTVLTRIEAVINSRLLTTVGDDVRDLTPKFQQKKVQRGSDTCISRSFLTISGSAGEESTCISYQSEINGCVNSQPLRSET